MLKKTKRCSGLLGKPANLRKTILGQSLRIAFSTTALSLIAVSGAYAQSNATGTIYGNVGTTSGATVVIESIATNAKRTVTPDATGRFQATSLPPGLYRVQLMKGDAVVSTADIEVLLGQGVEAVFAAAGAQQLQTVQIAGSRAAIDVSTTNSGSTFTAAQLATLPLTQNLNSIIQLAPDTVKADPRYAGGASIGGGAPSENSYYINGFPVTNALTQLGSIELPWGAIQQAQVLTGGFGVEFGRSIGGVLNITTKSGTNTWTGGGSVYVEPNSLKSKQKDIYYPNTGAPENAATDGKLRVYNQNNGDTAYNYGAFVGGPIIKDKLFVFIAADQTRHHVSGTNGGPPPTPDIPGAIDASLVGTSGWVDEHNKSTRYLGKLDWNITDNHRFEFTTLGDNYYADKTYYPFSYNTLSQGSTPSYSAHFQNEPGYTPQVGGSANILKYTGNLTPDFTVTALYGQSKTKHVETYNPDLSGGLPGVIWTSTGRDQAAFTYTNAQPLAGQNIDPPSAEDTAKSFRLDAEYVWGAHTLRAGLDDNKLKSSSAGVVVAGGSTYSYRFTANPTKPVQFGPYTYVVADGSVEGNKGYYVRQRAFSSVTDARSDQSAQYIEDRWQVNKDVLVTLGLRNESFTGINGDGETYLDSKNFLSPRIGAVWDVSGNSTFKVFGNVGRYSVQTPTHLAVRGAGRSTLVDQYFTYTGVDPVTGAPTGLRPLTAAPFSPDGETGLPKDPNTVAAKDPKPSYQDELILGLEKALSPKLTFGGKVTYRQLKATMDDMCDERPFDRYADAHGIDRTNYAFNCITFNPGQSNRFLVDYGNNHQYTDVTLSAQELGFEKAKRTFFALDFFLEHPFSQGWYGKVAYTYSQSKGNTEGQTKSDIGQTDVSATQTWDFPELMEHSWGYLPSDRRHQIKAFGYYQLTPEWGFGGIGAVSSGRPKNCIGNYGGTSPDGDYGGYGNAFFYCQFTGTTAPVITSRGSQGRLPWDYSIDANVVYQPYWAKGLTLRADVFNLFNKQTAQAVYELHEPSNDPSTTNGTYGQVLRYSAPRSVRMTAQYTF